MRSGRPSQRSDRPRLSAGEEDLAAIEAAFLSVLNVEERDELRRLLRRLEPPPVLGDLYRGGPPPGDPRSRADLDDWYD